MDNKKNYFSSLPKSKYLELIPNFNKEKTQAVTTLTLTLLALSFFGIFAINPTLSTIADLRKEINDDTFVSERMDQKIANLRSLQYQYMTLQPDLPTALNALPETPKSTELLAKIQALAKSSNVTLSGLSTGSVTLFGAQANSSTNTTSAESGPSVPSMTFSVNTTGSYQNLSGFVSSLSNFDRIVTYDGISLSSNNKSDVSSLQLLIQGKTYYLSK